MHPVITQEEPDIIHLFRWGLIPFWSKDMKIGSKMINARIEGIEEKPAFRQAFHKRRCIVPFDGYYEWQKTPDGKIPFRIQIKDGTYSRLPASMSIGRVLKESNKTVYPDHRRQIQLSSICMIVSRWYCCPNKKNYGWTPDSHERLNP